jgi:hypothetical protein
MASTAVSRTKIPTENPQLRSVEAVRPARPAGRSRPGQGAARVSGDTRKVTRGDDRVVVVTDSGVTVYPAREPGDRWRAVWYENGRRRQCEAASEDRLAARLEKVTERLAADAPNMERPGGDLIAFYLSPGRHPAGKGWSRKHTDTQRRLCDRYLAPVIGGVACEDIKTGHLQEAVNAAPTAGEGDRVRRCISALVTAGIAGGYLTSPRLKLVHWQPGEDRPVPEPAVTVAGESVLFVDPSEIPAAADVAKLGQALAYLGEVYELMANTAAYTGLRWGELAALTHTQVTPATRTVDVDVDRKIIEIGGTLYSEPPKGRKCRRTIYPAKPPTATLSPSRSLSAPNSLLLPTPAGSSCRPCPTAPPWACSPRSSCSPASD